MCLHRRRKVKNIGGGGGGQGLEYWGAKFLAGT